MRRLINKIKRDGLYFCVKQIISIFFYNLFRRIQSVIIQLFLPVQKNVILFSSTPGFSDNSKALYEYILENEKGKWEFIWLLKQNDVRMLEMKEITKQFNTAFIVLDSKHHPWPRLQAIWAIARSKYIFYTHSSPVKYFPKREGQIIINLWHGCGYKDVERNNVAWFKQNYFDFALVPGKAFIIPKSIFWGCDMDRIVEMGYPRYDLFQLYNPNVKEYVDNLRKKTEKLIFWMPTYRKTEKNIFPEEKVQYVFDLPILTSQKQVDELNEICRNNDILLCIKRHPYQVVYSCEHKRYSNIRFISNEDLVKNKIDLYSLIPYSDALISDYSSVAIDYLLLNKPIAFALDDFELYKSTRGFVFDDPLLYMPGHHVYNISHLENFFQDVRNGRDVYIKERERVKHLVHNPCENYSERIWKFVKSI